MTPEELVLAAATYVANFRTSMTEQVRAALDALLCAYLEGRDTVLVDTLTCLQNAKRLPRVRVPLDPKLALSVYCDAPRDMWHEVFFCRFVTSAPSLMHVRTHLTGRPDDLCTVMLDPAEPE